MKKQIPIKASVFVLSLIMIMTWLVACREVAIPMVATLTVSAPKYPFIPIPANVYYEGIRQLQNTPAIGKYNKDVTEISFYANNTDYPTESGAISYAALLEQQGWQPCKVSDCDFVLATDTNFLGAYQYGDGINPPLLLIGINTMIDEDQATSLFVKNCGIITETKLETSSSSTGCIVMLPKQLAPSPQ